MTVKAVVYGATSQDQSIVDVLKSEALLFQLKIKAPIFIYISLLLIKHKSLHTSWTAKHSSDIFFFGKMATVSAWGLIIG